MFFSLNLLEILPLTIINIFFFFISTKNIEFNFGTHKVPSPNNNLFFHTHFTFEFFINKSIP